MDNATLNDIHSIQMESSLVQMTQAEGLCALTQPSISELCTALDHGMSIPLSSTEDSGRPGTAVAELTRGALDETLHFLFDAQQQEQLMQGVDTLCLAMGRLSRPGLVSGPLMLRPVRLRKSEQGWLLLPSGLGQKRNAPLLRAFTPDSPEGGWADGFEAFYAQLNNLTETRGDWSCTQELWLGRFPYALLDMEDRLSDTPCAGSAWDALEKGELPDAPALAPEDCSGEENLLAPMELSAQQMTALRRLHGKGSLLVKGSVGTGKTQLAAALVANAMGERQRVLFVSPAQKDREGILERMQSLGLDGMCLPLSGSGDQRQEILHRFNLSAQLRPSTSSEDYFSLASDDRNLANQLDVYARLIHRPCACGMTLFDLIRSYLEYQDAEGHIPIPESYQDQLTPKGLQERLDCADELHRLAGEVKRPWAHPLRAMRITQATQENIDALPQAVSELQDAAQRLRQSEGAWLEYTGMSPAEMRGDWSQLNQVARLLLQWRDLPDTWKASPRIPMLAEAVNELKSRNQLMHDLHQQIDQAWGTRVLSLDAIELEKQWRYYQSDWILPLDADRESALRRLLAEANAVLSSLEQLGVRWSKMVNMSPPTSRDSWERCCEVAAELARWKEIPREWSSCDNLSGLLWDVGELITVGRKAKESKDVLLRNWTDEIFSLDGHSMLEQWKHVGGAWGLGLLRLQNEIRVAMEPMCKTKATTDLIESSLRWLADYQDELRQCEVIYHRWERELKDVYRREDTVWVWLETARRVAEESRDWLTELTGSNDFLHNYGSDEAIVSCAAQLQAQWERSWEVLGKLDVMLNRTSQSEGTNWIAERRADCRRLRNLLTIRLQLASLVSAPIPMDQTTAILGALAEYQRQEEALDNLTQRWSEELDGLYQGEETQWEELQAMAGRAVASDEQISQFTGDLMLRSRLACDEQAMEAAQTLADAFDDVTQSERWLTDAFAVPFSTSTGSWLDQLCENADLLLEQREVLPVWTEWILQRQKAESLGLRAFAARYDQANTDTDLPRLFRKSIYRWALMNELNRQPQRFSSVQFNDTLRKYTRTHRLYLQRTREELFHLGCSYAVRALRAPEYQSEVALLRQANKTGALESTAPELLDSLPGLLGQCFPCVIADPLDAMRFFRSGRKPPFDYVILSSAPRIPDPLGRYLLGLGNTALVMSGNETAASAFPGAQQSIWQTCANGNWPVLTLSTCYLPRPAALHWLDQVAYGTQTLPTAQPPRPCMVCKTVVGRLEGDVNIPEADAIVSSVEQALEHGWSSFAVVAMSLSQRSFLRSRMSQAARTGNQALADVPVLIPEEVRPGGWDTVLLSLGVAPDRKEQFQAAKRMAAAWDGWYHLSRAIAGARERVLVFSSLDKQDWPQLRSVSPQLVTLLEHLEQPDQLTIPLTPSNQIQEELCEALNRAGYVATAGPLPVSVQVSLRRHPDVPLLGILLDDDTYASLIRTPEREYDRTQLLQHRGWRLCRVWAMDWWRSRRDVVDGVCRLIERIQAAPAPAIKAAPAAPAKADAPQLPLYQPAQLSVIGIRSGEFSSPAFRARVTRVADEILQQESPISESQLTNHLLTAFGLDAYDPQLRQVCRRMWDALGLRVTREDALRFLWTAAQDPDRWRGCRRSGEGEHYRAPSDVSAQESANAACFVLAQHTTLTPRSLARETARVLGYDPDQNDALDCGRRGVEHALFLGRIMETVTGSLIQGVRK